jgi:pilus assembly protein CpaB
VTLQVTPEQAEKLALASSEGRLQLVMRNSIDQGDEVTSGATKQTLLSGERAQPVPEPGLDKGTKPVAPRSNPAPRRPRPAASETAAKVNTPAPAPVRPSVEVIEGSKKKNVDFPY